MLNRNSEAISWSEEENVLSFLGKKFWRHMNLMMKIHRFEVQNVYTRKEKKNCELEIWYINDIKRIN